MFFNSDHEEWMKELSYYDQHHVTDFLTAAKMQFIITIPLMQFAIIFWGERLIHMNDDSPEIHDLEYIRYLITVQAFLALYLNHISFYSAESECWDQIGIYVHGVVALLVYLILPGIIIGFTSYHANESLDTAYGGVFATTVLCNAVMILIGLIWIRKDFVSAYGWYKDRHEKKKEPIVQQVVMDGYLVEPDKMGPAPK